MAEPFFSADELSALQEAALPGMQTDIEIYHQTAVTTGGIPSSDDYGDDVETYPVITDPDTGLARVVKGWLFQRLTPVAQEDTGAVVTVNTIRLYVPLGTPISVGDKVTVVGDPDAIDYVVADTNNEITWKAWISCSLREIE